MSLAYVPALAAQPLRDYQHRVVDALRRSSGKRLMVQLPTGAGKTVTANAYVALDLIRQGKRVLWVTKDWWLIRQAAADLYARHRHARGLVGRLGGDGELPELPENVHAQVVYTTIHTLSSRIRSVARLDFDVVFIDEVHWGEDGPMYRKLERAYGDEATFIGLTATPRAWSDYELVAKVGFQELVDAGWLARPVVEVCRNTGVIWTPSLTGDHGDFTPTSLGVLARSRKRNETIVRTWVENQDRYGKTIVFACNIDHARDLVRRFRDKGVPADCLHSRMCPTERDEVIGRFQAGSSGRAGLATRVLVNVAMATHGVDIPDIRTVFLARPTASDILFVQMAGRGARIAPGKDCFYLVDFVDSLTRHGEKLRRPDAFYGAGGSSGGGDRAAAPRPSSPKVGGSYRYEHSPIQVYLAEPGYEPLNGLEFQPMQSFGIEFELTREGFDGDMPPDWGKLAAALLEAVRAVVGPERAARKPLREYHDESKSHAVWNVERDGSCGWEVTSPVLLGVAGIREAFDVAKTLDATAAALGLRVGRNTGTHVHLGWGRPDYERLKRLYRWVAYAEPALFSLVPPSRYRNDYCQPVRRSWEELERLRTIGGWERWFDEDGARYLTVNAKNLFGELGTVEVRMHSGTLDGPKILTWLSVWMRILEAVDRGVEPPADVGPTRQLPLSAGLEGDIVRLLAGLGAGLELRQAVDARRRHVVANSWLAGEAYDERAREVLASWGSSASG